MRRIVIHPVYVEEADGSWTAWYPEHGWEVTGGASKDEALILLRQEDEKRKQDPAYIQWLTSMFENPPESWFFEDTDSDTYEERMKGIE